MKKERSTSGQAGKGDRGFSEEMLGRNRRKRSSPSRTKEPAPRKPSPEGEAPSRLEGFIELD